MGARNRIGQAEVALSIPHRTAPPSPRAGSILDLRNLLAERFPQSLSPPAGCLATGLPAFDETLGGGLRKGAITELTSPNLSAGSALFISTLLQVAHREAYFMALVDGRDSFDPQPLGQARLRNLLWVRCRQATEAVKAADLLLRDGNFPLVILDLILNGADELRKIPQTTWYRLQRLVEPAPTAFLVLTRRSTISSAQWKLVLENAWMLSDLKEDREATRLGVRVQRAQGGGQPLAGVG